MIGIGALLGGPKQEGSPIDVLLSATMQAAVSVCGKWEQMTTPRLNVNFCVPGPIVGYEDVPRIDVGRFSPKKRAIVVRMRVPSEIVEAGGSVQFIVDSLLEASRLAAEVFARKGVDGFELVKVEEAVDQIGRLVKEKLKGRL